MTNQHTIQDTSKAGSTSSAMSGDQTTDYKPRQGWHVVTQDEFYKAIGPLNVNGELTGSYPYTTLLKTPGGQVRGIREGYLPKTGGQSSVRFWLPN